MSSEESCNDDDVQPGPGLKLRKIRRLSWEREKLLNIKRATDDKIKSNMTAAQKRLSLRLIIANDKSLRPMPKSIPSWAAKDETTT